MTDTTLAEFLRAEWLPAIRSTVRPATYFNYVSHVESHVVPRLGDLALTELDGRTINRFYSQLLSEGRRDRQGGLAASTVRRLHAALHKALKDAVRWGYLSTNPVDAADPPKLRVEGPREMTTWSPEQLRAFLEFARGDRFYPLWFVLATTGMRRGEALGLRWCDVDLRAGHLAVRQNLVEAGRALRVSSPKTARGRRVVAIDRRTCEVLEEHRACSPDADASDLVFGCFFDRAVSPTLVTKRFRDLAQEAGLPRIRLHDLRHTHATLALEAGVHPKIVSERLGHSTVSLTLDVYSHAVPHMQRDAADAIARVLFSE
ncbi:MAG TPA: tyrosine-type recombinase/integrase [Actinomycetota bacterium]|nr:tyrosine-type recombinase/integrase [Actinomycetota bacterium]